MKQIVGGVSNVIGSPQIYEHVCLKDADTDVIGIYSSSAFSRFCYSLFVCFTLF